MVLTRRAVVSAFGLAVAVGILVAGGVPVAVAIVLVNAALAVVVVVDILRAASPAAVALGRSGDTRTRLGETAEIILTVRNTGSRRLRGTLRDAWVPTANATIAGPAGTARHVRPAMAGSGAGTGAAEAGEGGSGVDEGANAGGGSGAGVREGSRGGGPTRERGGSDRAPIDIPAGGLSRLHVQVRPSRRGDRPADRVTIRSLGPLGIAGRQRSLPAPWSVRTLPPFTSRRHLPSRLARLRDLDGRALVAVRGAGSEFDSLREYVPGDDVRSIDWRASARAADVMVRTWRPERDRRMMIVLDTGRTCAARIGDETRLDVLIDAALLLAALAGRAGDRVDVLAHDRRTGLHVRGASGADLLPSLADALAMVEPRLVETDHRGLVASVLSRLSKRSLVVVLTSLDRPAMQEGFLPALPVLTARHNVVVAAVREPHLTAITPDGVEPRLAPARRRTRDDVSGAYRNAASARAESERRWVGSALARMGVRVVDAGPDDLAAKLADAYLDLKAAGRL